MTQCDGICVIGWACKRPNLPGEHRQARERLQSMTFGTAYLNQCPDYLPDKQHMMLSRFAIAYEAKKRGLNWKDVPRLAGCKEPDRIRAAIETETSLVRIGMEPAIRIANYLGVRPLDIITYKRMDACVPQV